MPGLSSHDPSVHCLRKVMGETVSDDLNARMREVARKAINVWVTDPTERRKGTEVVADAVVVAMHEHYAPVVEALEEALKIVRPGVGDNGDEGWDVDEMVDRTHAWFVRVWRQGNAALAKVRET